MRPDQAELYQRALRTSLKNYLSPQARCYPHAATAAALRPRAHTAHSRLHYLIAEDEADAHVTSGMVLCVLPTARVGKNRLRRRESETGEFRVKSCFFALQKLCLSERC